MSRQPVMTLSNEYAGTYDDLLSLLGRHCLELPHTVCLHWPMHQDSYAGKLLVVGQALNGWVVESSSCHLTREDRRQALLTESRAVSESATAFRWMSPLVRSRPFWRLADLAMASLGQRLDQIAWSNLAKVAPATGRNPHRELLWSQHRLGGALLRQEVAELNPELVLVVSGRAYAEPFLRDAGIHPRWERRGGLEFDGLMEGRRWIVVSHPGTFASRYEASSGALAMALERP